MIQFIKKNEDVFGGPHCGKQEHEFKPLFKDEMEVLLKLCCFTGCDGQSGCLMKWDGVNMDMNTISYIREKTIKATGGKVITLPIHPVLRDALEKAQSWREADCPYILPHVAERYKRNHWGVQKDVQKIIHCALKVDVTNRESVGKRAMPANRYSLHSFRHSFVSIAVKSGVPLDVVSEIVGHGNPLMTEHYRHIHDDSKQAAIAALPDMGADVDIKPKDITPDVLRLQIATFVNNAELPDLQMVWHFIEELQKSRPKQLVEHAQHQAVEE